MIGKIKNKVRIVLVILITVFFICSVFKLFEIQNHNKSYRSKIIEYEYLRLIINDSNGNLAFFKYKWGDKFKTKGRNSYIIEAKDVLSDPFFSDKKYVLGTTDFYGYEFQFDNKNKLKASFFIKP